ncbi:hypothetical protein QQS21_004287 [Conoideocrella luteorostrata]|uniref:N-acetyltransferase domain-containing protein n=1 Tax=Conoideocrella luteorostrata TaxID=1105319 RepID=A0AAJ0CRT6_9HYPO|nr:hypothetical protein QQS21_004287 [Conoideocrella luteorostrata]
MAKSTFSIVIPLADDAPVISGIHLRAMQDNLLTHAQFPNPRAVEYFRGWITQNTIQHVHDGGKGVLIARDPASGQVASFIKWLEYGTGGEVSPPPPDSTNTSAVGGDVWPEFCGRDILDEYANVAAGARKKLLGEREYFHVTFLCTDPNWGGRGAASALLRELEGMAADAGKAIILEAVMPAVPLYKRLGFDIRQQLRLMLPPRGSTNRTELYLEESMVWTPPSQEVA